MKYQSVKNRSLLALTLANIIFPTASFAVDGFSSCNALLTSGLYNIGQSSSATDSESLKKSYFCSEKYSESATSAERKAKIKASYGGFGGDASGSVNETEINKAQEKICTEGYDSTKYAAKASQFAQNVNQGSLEAWNKCQALAKKGIDFELQTDQSMQGAIVTLSSSTGLHYFNGLDQIGLGRSICTTTRKSNTGSSTGKVLTVDKTTSLKFDSASTLTITCDRQMSSDGKGGLFADAQSLVFTTDEGSYQVPMVTIGLSPRVSIEEAVAKLESSVNSKIAEVKTDLTSTVNTVAKEAGNSIQGLQNGVNLLHSVNPHDKSDCTWHPIETNTNFVCPTRKFVSGVCLTNIIPGCLGANGTIAPMEGNTWGAGGAVLCCNVD